MAISQVTPFVEYAEKTMRLRYSRVVGGVYETWDEIAGRVVHHVVSINDKVDSYVADTMASYIFEAIRDRKFIPGGRILSQAGRPYHQTDNCYTLRAADTREGWADLAHKCTMMFMSGGGVGVDYGDIRPYGAALQRSGGIASGPLPLIELVNSIAAAARAGGERRGACYASLPYHHGDILEFIAMKTNRDALKHTNISVQFNDEAFGNDDCYLGNDIFMDTLKHACQYGEPGFQFDTDNQTLRNACGEVISADDSDSCCIGSVNMAAIRDVHELADVVNLGILFLLCNTLYTDFPTTATYAVKQKNRRLGLGLMGIGEWFIQRSQPYGFIQAHQSENITAWLDTYRDTAQTAALYWSNKLNISTPVATRAIAPTGTISIVGGHTTSGIEPVFHTAYQRTVNTLKTQQYSDGYIKETVVEPIVQKWIEQGYDVRDIDTAYTLSQSVDGIERRIKFQAYVQQFVDNAIASTVNLPAYAPGIEDTIALILLRYLPQLRGITFYPDGARDNQPVVPVDIGDVDFDTVNMQQHDSCANGECGL